MQKNERARTDLSATQYGEQITTKKNEGKINQYTRNAVPHHGEGQSKTSILKDAGITHPERYEAIASLPDEVKNRSLFDGLL